MMTCCTFVYSVINLTWNKQYVFFILVVSNFYGIPLTNQVCNKAVNKKFHRLETQKLLQHYLLKKRRSAKVQRKWRATGTKICVFTVIASTTDRKIAEPGFKMDSPVRITEEENTGQNDTLMKKPTKDPSHRSQPSRITSHHYKEADRCWLKSYSTYAWPH